MGEIFVIISGEYSDWSIIGYTDNEDDATQICAQHNKDLSYEDWYYYDINRVESPKQRIPLQYIHTVRFNRGKHGVLMSDYFTLDYYPELSGKSITKTEIENAPAWIIVRVPLKEVNWDRAKKIAQDAIYKYLYEKQGN